MDHIKPCLSHVASGLIPRIHPLLIAAALLSTSPSATRPEIVLVANEIEVEGAGAVADSDDDEEREI